MGLQAAIAGRAAPTDVVEPAEVLAEMLKVKIPLKIQQGTPGLFGRAANPQMGLAMGAPAYYRLTDEERRILTSLEGADRVYHAPLPAALSHLFEMRYARVLGTTPGSKTLTGRRVFRCLPHSTRFPRSLQSSRTGREENRPPPNPNVESGNVRHRASRIFQRQGLPIPPRF